MVGCAMTVVPHARCGRLDEQVHELSCLPLSDCNDFNGCRYLRKNLSDVRSFVASAFIRRQARSSHTCLQQ